LFWGYKSFLGRYKTLILIFSYRFDVILTHKKSTWTDFGRVGPIYTGDVVLGTRTRTQSTRTRTRGLGTRTRTRTRGFSTRTRTRTRSRGTCILHYLGAGHLVAAV